MGYLPELRFYIALIVGILATVWDLKYRKIPNWLTFPGILAGLVLNIAGDVSHWPFPFMGLLTGLLLLIVPYVGGGIGTGDVKLLMALGAILGAKGVFWTTIYGAIAGGLLSLGLVIRRYRFGDVFNKFCLLIPAIWNPDCRHHWLQRDDGEKLYIPYGVAIAAGFIYFWAMGPK